MGVWFARMWLVCRLHQTDVYRNFLAYICTKEDPAQAMCRILLLMQRHILKQGADLAPHANAHLPADYP